MACGRGTRRGRSSVVVNDDDVPLKLNAEVNNSTSSAANTNNAVGGGCPSLSDNHSGGSCLQDDRNKEDTPLCLSFEGRALRKRYELTVKAAAFLTDPAHRRMYDEKFQRHLKYVRALQDRDKRRRKDRMTYEDEDEEYENDDDNNDDDDEYSSSVPLIMARKGGGRCRRLRRK
jgi:hypothetical protein